LDSSEKLKDNSRADNTGLTDCYIIKKEIMLKCKIIPNSVKQREHELEKGGEIPEKWTQRTTKFPK